jgi:hypothetical protein
MKNRQMFRRIVAKTISKMQSPKYYVDLLALFKRIPDPGE